MNNSITKAQAQEFYRDLCGAYNGSSTKECCGVATVAHIADTMRLSIERTTALVSAMLRYGITETSGGRVII